MDWSKLLVRSSHFVKNSKFAQMSFFLCQSNFALRITCSFCCFSKHSFLPSESEFRLMKNNTEISVAENHPVTINCTLGSGSTTSLSHYSITWYFNEINSSATLVLAKFGPRGELDPATVVPQGMSFYRTALDTFRLTIHKARVNDSGDYSCLVEEHQLGPERTLLLKATDESGVTRVSVESTGMSLFIHSVDVAQSFTLN